MLVSQLSKLLTQQVKQPRKVTTVAHHGPHTSHHPRQAMAARNSAFSSAARRGFLALALAAFTRCLARCSLAGGSAPAPQPSSLRPACATTRGCGYGPGYGAYAYAVPTKKSAASKPVPKAKAKTTPTQSPPRRLPRPSPCPRPKPSPWGPRTCRHWHVQDVLRQHHDLQVVLELVMQARCDETCEAAALRRAAAPSGT